MTASTAIQPAVAASGPGRNELGMISINDQVVEKVAAGAGMGLKKVGKRDIPELLLALDATTSDGLAPLTPVARAWTPPSIVASKPISAASPPLAIPLSA